MFGVSISDRLPRLLPSLFLFFAPLITLAQCVPVGTFCPNDGPPDELLSGDMETEKMVNGLVDEPVFACPYASFNEQS